jgi:hypothetical protein
MANVQKQNVWINVPSSQTVRSYWTHVIYGKRFIAPKIPLASFGRLQFTVRINNFCRDQLRWNSWTIYRTLSSKEAPFKVGLTDDPICERCLEEDESVTHVLCDCEAIAQLRFRHLGQFFMEPSDYYNGPISTLNQWWPRCRGWMWYTSLTYLHKYIHVYIYACMHTYIHTYIHTIAPIFLGRCPSLSAHESESMLRTYLVCL